MSKTLKVGLGVIACLATSSACGRSTELGSDLDAGSGASGNGGHGGNGGNATGGSAGGGEEALGTRFWEGAGSEGCPTVGRPSKDQRPNSDSGGDLVLHLGMSEVDLGDGGPDDAIDDQRWKEIGFDLDLGCNAASWPDDALTDPQRQACPALRERACQNPFQNIFDGDYCRDNAAGGLFGILSLSPIAGDPFRLTGSDWNCAIHRGSMGILFKISGYNGEANDSAVRLDVYSSVGVSEPANWDCRRGESNDDALDPAWSSQAGQPLTKQWMIPTRDIRAGAAAPEGDFPDSKWADATAFVRSGWLIAELPKGTELWFNGLNAQTPGLRLQLNNGLLAARLERDPESDQWRFSDATLGATTTPAAMTTALREIGYCENLCDSYTTTIGYLNQTVDMLSSTSDPVPDAACDALSFGMHFTAESISPGPVIEVPAPPDVAGGKCGTPRNPDVPKPGCTCAAPPSSGCD